MCAQGPKELFKADIDSAYRRVPLLPEHRKYANIMFLFNDVVYVCAHLAMMFGAVASVHAWHRVACLLRAIARRCLKLPMLCFVDDFFSVESSSAAEHAKQCFARLVRACLGDSAVAPHKLSHGNPLEILGIDVTLSDSGVTFWPAPAKVAKWLAEIERFLSLGVMHAGEASKLAGQLQWGAQHIFKRLGRAMLRPIFDHIRAVSTSVGKELELALRWWKEVLLLQVQEERAWGPNSRKQVHLFADARSTPPHIAAVLVV